MQIIPQNVHFIPPADARKHLFDQMISGILSVMDKNAFESAKLKVLLKQNDPHGFGTPVFRI